MPYGYRGLKIFTSLSLRFQDFQRRLIIVVELPARNLFLRAWEVQVGRVSLYLLDSNDLMNSPVDRAIHQSCMVVVMKCVYCRKWFWVLVGGDYLKRWK